MADEIKITTATEANRLEYKQKTSKVLARTFRTDPVIRYITCSLSEDAHLAYLQPWFDALMKGAYLNSAIFQEASNFQSVAVWMPPGKRVDNEFTLLQSGLIPIVLKLGLGGVKRIFWGFQAQTDKAKKKHLSSEIKKKGYWYLFFIATEEEARGRGLAAAVIKGWQEVAGREGRAIWLEATTERSRRVYERCGFVVVEELVVGEGTHASSGVVEKGGPGVRIWAMLWKPGEGKGTVDG